MRLVILSKITIAFILFFTQQVFGQEPTISSVELLSPSIAISPQNGVIEGMTEEGEIIYGFRALVGIKAPNEKVKSGEVAAGGNIKHDGSKWETANTIFYRVSNYTAGSDYYTSATEGSKILASDSKQINFNEYNSNKIMANNWGHELPQLIDNNTKNSIYPSDTGPAGKYYFTKPYVKPSGKIGYIATYTYNLESADKAWSEPTIAYKKSIATNKVGHESMFNDKNVSYKGSMSTMDPIPFATNPVNGNMTMLGGLKSKKNGGKDKSHLYEFKMLSFNNEGEILGNEDIKSEEPIRVNSAHVIGQGDYLNGIAREAKSYIFEATGDLNGDDKANAKMRRYYTVDASSGKLLNSFDLTLPSKYAEQVAFINLPNTDIATFVYFHTAAKNRGFTCVSINSAGEKVNIQSFNDDFINRSSIPTDKLVVNTKMEILSIYDAEEGRKYIVAGLKVADKMVNEAVFIFEYDSNKGIIKGMPEPKDLLGTFMTSESNLLLLAKGDNEASLHLLGGNSDGLKNLLGEGTMIAGSKEAWLYLEDSKEIYLLTKTPDDKGLYLHKINF